VVGQKLDGEIIIYFKGKPNSILFDQSHTIKENKKKSW
jgi:hypothetical protein